MRGPLSVEEGRLGSSCPRKVKGHIWLGLSDGIDEKLGYQHIPFGFGEVSMV